MSFFVMDTVYAHPGGSPVPADDTWPSPATWHRGEMRVLVVEDFEILARTIGTGLRREGMAVDVVLDGDDALEHLAVHPVRRRGARPRPARGARRRGVPADRRRRIPAAACSC